MSDAYDISYRYYVSYRTGKTYATNIETAKGPERIDAKEQDQKDFGPRRSFPVFD